MANVTIDYGKVDTVAANLNRVVSETLPKLTSLQSAVTHLLTGSGGLWLKQSSPVLSSQYQEFNTSVTSAVQNITSFANQFNNIVAQVKAMDEAITKSATTK
jgi:hypothetical protein